MTRLRVGTRLTDEDHIKIDHWLSKIQARIVPNKHASKQCQLVLLGRACRMCRSTPAVATFPLFNDEINLLSRMASRKQVLPQPWKIHLTNCRTDSQRGFYKINFTRTHKILYTTSRFFKNFQSLSVTVSLCFTYSYVSLIFYGFFLHEINFARIVDQIFFQKLLKFTRH